MIDGCTILANLRASRRRIICAVSPRHVVEFEGGRRGENLKQI